MALSIKGDSMTLIVDCAEQITTKLRRTAGIRLPTDGLIFTGIQMLQEEGYYLGDIQMFLIANRPDEAFFMCTKYSPNCPGSVTLGGAQQIASNKSTKIGSRTSGSSRISSWRNSGSSTSASFGSSGSAKGSLSSLESEMKIGNQRSLSNGSAVSGGDTVYNSEGQAFGNVDSSSSGHGLLASSSRVAITAGVLGESAAISSNVAGTADLSLDQPNLPGPSNHRRKNETSNLAALTVDETAASKPKRTSGNAKQGADEIYDYLDYGNEDYFEVKDELGAANDTRGNKKKGNLVKVIRRIVQIN